jgi:hypothetical protein
MYVALLVVAWLHGGPAAFILAAAISLCLLGVLIYFGLVRDVLRGPMLAQILSTFGLALLLRYIAFWIFSANVVSLPQTGLSGVVNLGGIFMPLPHLVAGLAAIALTLALHLVLTRTSMGSRLLAVAEDRNAAMLMGIRPGRTCRSADGDRLSVVSLGRRDVRADVVRRSDARRIRQRARRPDRRIAHRTDPGAVGLLPRGHLQGRCRLRPLCRAAVVQTAGPDGQSVRRSQ